MSDAAAAAAAKATEAAAAKAAETAAATSAGGTVTKLKKKPEGLGVAGSILGVLAGLLGGAVVAAGGFYAWKHRRTILAALSPGDSPETKQATVTQFPKKEG